MSAGTAQAGSGSTAAAGELPEVTQPLEVDLPSALHQAPQDEFQMLLEEPYWCWSWERRKGHPRACISMCLLKTEHGHSPEPTRDLIPTGSLAHGWSEDSLCFWQPLCVWHPCLPISLHAPLPPIPPTFSPMDSASVGSRSFGPVLLS